MKVVYLTAGAAGMFCGSCMHDNTLARALTQTGLDVELIPTYTPIRTDEENVSVDQVFFGGLNVYLQQKIPLFRHLPGFLDRFLDNPWLIRKVTSGGVDASPELLGSLTLSMLKGTRGNQRKEVFRLCRWLQHHSQPDLIVLTNALIAGCVPHLKKELGVPIVVTLQGDDIFLKELPEKYREPSLIEIARIADHVDGFIAHSRFYADAMSVYLGIARDKIHVTPLGIDVDDFAGSHTGSFRPANTNTNLANTAATNTNAANTVGSSGPLVIGYLARLAPEKGLHCLVDAFIRMHEQDDLPDVRLHIAGWLAKHRESYAEEQFEKLRQAGLSERFHHAGSIARDAKVHFLDDVDVLCVPTTYHEPKGLFVLEAWAAGIPVVLPAHGAFPELIDDCGGGLLVEPDNVDALAVQLTRLVRDDEERKRLGQAGRRGRE